MMEKEKKINNPIFSVPTQNDRMLCAYVDVLFFEFFILLIFFLHFALRIIFFILLFLLLSIHYVLRCRRRFFVIVFECEIATVTIPQITFNS